MVQTVTPGLKRMALALTVAISAGVLAITPAAAQNQQMEQKLMAIILVHGQSRHTAPPCLSILRTMDNGGVCFSSTSLRIPTSRLLLAGNADLLWRNRQS